MDMMVVDYERPPFVGMNFEVRLSTQQMDATFMREKISRNGAVGIKGYKRLIGQRDDAPVPCRRPIFSCKQEREVKL
ncbi:hypothetical protein W02_37770 [Nitrospira sp. KM1]|nr:hypothetical protein W02_37770 [Nitrospira sp. KM1]